MTAITLSAREVVGLLCGSISVLRRPVVFPLKSRSDGAKQRVFRDRPDEIAELNGHLNERQRHPLCSVRGPFGLVGSVLTGKETWADVHPCAIAGERFSKPGCAGIPGPPPVKYRVIYRADGEIPAYWRRADHAHPWFTCHMKEADPIFVSAYPKGMARWESSATMPAWASRISIEVTGLRVERLDNATAHELRLEGITESDVKDPWFGDFDLFALANERWDSRFGKKFPASSNPLTWRAEVSVRK